jgi:hypothetical protein
MGFLRRVFRAPTAPEWASFMTAEQYRAFEVVLAADLRARRWTWRQDGDGLFVDGAPGEGPAAYGLTNIAQLCAAIDRAAWPTAIAEHFDHLASLHVPGTDADDAMAWVRVRGLLKLRLFPAEAATQHEMVTYPLAPSIVASLAVDFPTTVATPGRDGIADWPPVDELYEIAIANLRAEPPPQVDVVGDPLAPIQVVLDDSFFTASRLLLLPEGVDMGGAPDAIVAIPNRHTLLVHPLRDANAVLAVNTMTQLAARMCAAGPGSIVPDVFWWHTGALTVIPSQTSRKGIDIFPPAAFVERLNGLPPGPSR